MAKLRLDLVPTDLANIGIPQCLLATSIYPNRHTVKPFWIYTSETCLLFWTLTSSSVPRMKARLASVFAVRVSQPNARSKRRGGLADWGPERHRRGGAHPHRGGVIKR